MDGKTSMEMMLDTAFTLAHNNGPIFNKGMMYSHYNASNLYRILDVQRSGQIPEMILYDKLGTQYNLEPVKALIKLVQEKVPQAFGTYVDWIKVEALGALHKYPDDIKAQKAAHGHVEIEKAKAASNVIELGKWQITPTEHVVLFKRKKAA